MLLSLSTKMIDRKLESQIITVVILVMKKIMLVSLSLSLIPERHLRQMASRST